MAYRLLAVPVASVFCRKFEEIFADSKYRCIFAVPIGKPNAEIAQLVERNLAKVEVAGPSPVFRSKITTTGKVVVFLCPAVARRASRRHFAVACRLLAVPVRHLDRSGEIAKIGGAITAIFWGNGKKQGWKLLFWQFGGQHCFTATEDVLKGGLEISGVPRICHIAARPGV